jgi:hypothetical protein
MRTVIPVRNDTLVLLIQTLDIVVVAGLVEAVVDLDSRAVVDTGVVDEMVVVDMAAVTKEYV